MIHLHIYTLIIMLRQQLSTLHLSLISLIKNIKLVRIPLVHVDDVCEAHIFCMQNTSINGRFLCASSFISL